MDNFALLEAMMSLRWYEASYFLLLIIRPQKRLEVLFAE
jgi:hypothetical protein